MTHQRFTSSAPGKVILFGEHAVVYGTTAVAAALSDLRIVVDVELVQDNETTLEAILHDIASPTDPSQPFEMHISLSRIQELLGERHRDPLLACNPSEACMSLLRQEFSSCAPHSAAQCIMAICYLVARIIPEVVYDEAKFPAQIICSSSNGGISCDSSLSGNGNSDGIEKKHYGLKINVRSHGLPLGAGLGSSAAFSVALAGALILARQFMFLPKSFRVNKDDRVSTPPSEILPILNAWAYAAEVVIHGAPSGLDNTTSCYGGTMKYSNLFAKKFESLPPLPRMSILLTNTKVPGRETKLLVAGVRKIHDAMLDVIKPIIAAIDGIANKFLSLLAENETMTRSSFLEQVGILMSINHDLLGALGVGHPALTAVREASLGLKCACKLTGAGGGGCAITLLPEERADECAQELSENLR